MIDLILAGGAAVAFYAAGVLSGRRWRPTGPALPVCGCQHHLSMHDPETGDCHGVTVRTITPEGGGYPYDSDPEQCTCRRYIGPELLADIWSAPIAAAPPVDPPKEGR